MDFYLAKHGLSKTWDLRPKIGLISRRKKTVGREERKREEEEEEGEKKKRRRDVQARLKRYGTTKFDYVSLVCMIIILPKPRVLLGFHLNPKIMESKVCKTPYDTRWL